MAPGDLGCQARLAVDASEGGLRIRHDRFDLGDEHDPGRRVEPEDVDRTAFATNRERNFDFGDPACGLEPLDKCLDEVGMGLIEESIQASPFQRSLRSRVASSASATRRNVPSGIDWRRPRSILEITDGDTSALAARSSWRKRLCNRSARNE